MRRALNAGKERCFRANVAYAKREKEGTEKRGKTVGEERERRHAIFE